MKIGWFSCGVTSAVACKIASQMYDDLELYYIEIDSAHQDNERFIQECEKWIGLKVKRIRGTKYVDQFDVIRETGYVNGVAGAACTKWLKKEVRKKLEREVEYDGQIFGFEYSKKEINRAIRFTQQHDYALPLFPLIDQKITKAECAEILLKNGIQLPTMYLLGFHNNNCIGCVKGGKGYWNHIRRHFPEYFKEMALCEREAKHSCIKGTFLDELKENEGVHLPPIVPDCGTFCEIKFADILDDRAEEVFTGIKTMKQLHLF